MTDIVSRIREIVRLHLGIAEDELSDDMSFVQDLDADSLEAIEMVMAFETEFGCSIPDEAVRKMITIADAAAYVARHGTGDGPAAFA